MERYPSRCGEGIEAHRALFDVVVPGNPTWEHPRVDLARVWRNQVNFPSGNRLLAKFGEHVDVSMSAAKENEPFHV